MITFREDHVDNHTTKLLNLAFGHSIQGIEQQLQKRRSKEQTINGVCKISCKKNKDNIINNVAADRDSNLRPVSLSLCARQVNITDRKLSKKMQKHSEERQNER